MGHTLLGRGRGAALPRISARVSAIGNMNCIVQVVIGSLPPRRTLGKSTIVRTRIQSVERALSTLWIPTRG